MSDNKKFHCPKCRRFIGLIVADGQALILENSGIGIWNFARFQCLTCSKNISWESSLILPDLENINALENIPIPVGRDLPTGVTRTGRKYKASYNNIYLGVYDSPALAYRAYLAAKGV